MVEEVRLNYSTMVADWEAEIAVHAGDLESMRDQVMTPDEVEVLRVQLLREVEEPHRTRMLSCRSLVERRLGSRGMMEKSTRAQHLHHPSRGCCQPYPVALIANLSTARCIPLTITGVEALEQETSKFRDMYNALHREHTLLREEHEHKLKHGDAFEKELEGLRKVQRSALTCILWLTHVRGCDPIAHFLEDHSRKRWMVVEVLTMTPPPPPPSHPHEIDAHTQGGGC
jgi:hypothetical protein